MVISVLDHVAQCYTWQDGAAIAAVIRPALQRGEPVVVSFAGVTDVPSSFVNAAFVALLNQFSFDLIRARLRVVNSNRQVNGVIRTRLTAEAGISRAA